MHPGPEWEAATTTRQSAAGPRASQKTVSPLSVPPRGATRPARGALGIEQLRGRRNRTAQNLNPGSPRTARKASSSCPTCRNRLRVGSTAFGAYNQRKPSMNRSVRAEKGLVRSRQLHTETPLDVSPVGRLRASTRRREDLSQLVEHRPPSFLRSERSGPATKSSKRLQFEIGRGITLDPE